MAQTVTPPKEQVPLGYVVIQGQRYEVTQHPEIVRFFQSLVTRVGGVTGASTTDLTVSQFEDAGIEETKVQVRDLATEFGQMPPPAQIAITQDDPDGRVNALEARIGALEAVIQGLQQGTAP